MSRPFLTCLRSYAGSTILKKPCAHVTPANQRQRA
jgi:hypothetical protein